MCVCMGEGMVRRERVVKGKGEVKVHTGGNCYWQVKVHTREVKVHTGEVEVAYLGYHAPRPLRQNWNDVMVKGGISMDTPMLISHDINFCIPGPP